MNVLLKSAKYSDLTLVCKGKEFCVHRAVLCPKSTFFDTACSKACAGDLSSQESYSGRIELEDDPATVERMISYVYTLDYRDEEHQQPESGSCDPMPCDDSDETSDSGCEEDQPALLGTTSVRVYTIADKYDIPPLKELAKTKFQTWGEKNWARKEFSDIVKEIFESTPKSDRGLRDIATRIVALHANFLIQKDEFRQLIGDLELGTVSLLLEEKADLEASMKAECAELQKELRQYQRNLNRKIKALDSTLKVFNEHRCNHCEKRLLNASVEVGINGYYSLTGVPCRSCQTLNSIFITKK
ncbi:hypothetical protein V8E54_009035 [Elaphomyces granulatus]